MKRTLEEANSSNKIIKTYGKIRVGGKSDRGGSGYAKCDKEAKGFLVLPIISKGKKPYNQLSPFFLGPIKDEKTGLFCKNFENFWQFQKVYQKVVKQNQKKKINGKNCTIWAHPEEIHVKNVKGQLEPNDNWYQWRNKGFECDFAIRRPNGTRKNGLPIYSYYHGKKLKYIEARQEIYIPFYKKLARETEIYKEILQMIKDGKNVMLIDVDGPNVKEYPYGREMTRSLIKELEVNEKIIFGHGYACADALLEDLDLE